MKKYIKLAFEMFYEDYDNSRYRTYHYAFLVRRNTILSIGKNQYNTPRGRVISRYFNVPHYEQYDCIHAEADAIRQMWGKNIRPRDKIIVIRVSNDGVQNSKPCKHCQKIIDALKLKSFYSSRSNERYIYDWSSR